MTTDGQTASCASCGEVITRTGNIWLHGTGLIMCTAMFQKEFGK